ncbi:MAG TPA: hypothetical protein PK765_04205 [bacterium]|nr:hypothetical protein [bacterium]
MRLACDDSIDDMTISQIETYHQQAVARHVTSYADARLISIINHNDAGAL